MNDYQAFGLRVASELPLPELMPSRDSHAAVDVRIRLGIVRGEAWTPREREQDARIVEGEALFYWKAVGAFAARDGRDILVEPAPGVADDLLRLPLLGAVTASVLEQRGDFVLHAGAVEINGGAAIFLGWKGAGKSTMTGALWKRGHRLLSDDIVAVRSDENEAPQVWPGFPQFKVWPDSAVGALGDDPNALPELHAHTDKRARLAHDGFSLSSCPLRRVFVLEEIPHDEHEAVSLQPVVAHEAVSQLIAHSYAARWGNDLLRGPGGAAHFKRCTRLAAVVPVVRLRRRFAMDLLPEVARQVEEEMDSDN